MRDAVQTDADGKHQCNHNCFIGAERAIVLCQQKDCQQYEQSVQNMRAK